jgi:aspartate-semialdehyde dehydrogenase
LGGQLIQEGRTVEKIPVAVLGAMGTIGQRFVSLLADHPWFELAAVTATERHQGRTYAEAVTWLLPEEIPSAVTNLDVGRSDDLPPEVRLVFSALPAAAAAEAELELAAAGYVVCSNASANRMQPDVPLLIPEINAGHLDLIARQRQLRRWPGLIVASPNCSTTGIVFPLKALQKAFGLLQVQVVTLQAISGAGSPGVPGLQIHDNVIPYIPGEEEKIEQETRKLLGELGAAGVEPAGFEISAQANRVPVMDGHLASLSVKLAREARPEQVEEVLREFQGCAQLPSAPPRPLILRSESDRPQPRLDRDALNGMAVSVGRVRPISTDDYRMITLVHNTIRGGAGGAVLNAELLVAQGYLGDYVPEAVSQRWRG